MKVLLAGASGMIGSLILTHCLESKQITSVVSFVRKKTSLNHEKLTEVLVEDFEDYSQHTAHVQGAQAVYFCIGVYTGAVSNDVFEKITVNYAVALAKAVKAYAPKATFCLLSGAGADRKEKSKTAFARFKGMAENQISALNLNFHTFRPGYIYPVTPRKEPNLMYSISRVLYPVLKLMGKNASIPSTDLANAMFHVGLQGAHQEVLENKDIFQFVKHT